MANLTDYRNYIQQILEKYSHAQSAYDDLQFEMIRDTEQDYYQLMTVGWHGLNRIYGCIFHLDIKNGKIWIQHDGTESGIANELVALGVPKEDIVLAFHAPYKRPYTGFATG